ncbi:vomeronasal type-2 receptor 26-like [Mixophyes fleayi]|uniref:vomeronasal type-2 receptor 26-like n=1 Tax=Mixophyes fleayi TaxID=3061075 RepID=UPI003F4D8DD5
MAADMRPYPQYYKNLITFLFAIEKFTNSYLLPNITLGYHVYDSCNDENKAIKSVLQILSGPGRTVPNYSCAERGKVIGFIGDHHSVTTVPMAKLLGVYPYSHISYGATNSVLGDRDLYPRFFRAVQNERTIYSMLCKLLEYFGWTWIGILASDDDSGDTETQLLINYAAKRRICVDFIIKMNIFNKNWIVNKITEIISKSTVKVIVLCGTFSQSFVKCLDELFHVLLDQTLVLNPHWAYNKFLMDQYFPIFNGSLAIENLPITFLDIFTFFKKFSPENYPEDKLLEHICALYYGCWSKNSEVCHYYGSIYKVKNLVKCSGKELIIRLRQFSYYGIYPRVYLVVLVIARALRNMRLVLDNEHQKMETKLYHFRHHLHHYLKNLKYSPNDSTLVFDENGDFVTEYNIYNWIMGETMVVRSLEVGKFTASDKDQQLFINESAIIWKNDDNQISVSRCSEMCLPGSKRISIPGIHPCCYDCAPCSEGEISNTTDSENCIKCQDDEWPNEKRDLCIPKSEDFLSYTNDEISAAFISVSVFFCFITQLILGIFISHRDTPIVKANNKNLSFLLLVSIMLSFLCVFLFLGRPVDITCMLRQISFGILFSIAVSSVLAKTIMVCIAFNATKPGSVWRKWMGVKLPNCVVCICSSVQVMISISWLSISPPFQELDTHSYQGQIIVQCNEGSVIGFYSVLGYMGVLAAVSFITAFIARTLPDSFNEAKYITFSMLVFCSVWIAMIPAYLSTKGKYMVAVEIFSILTSNAGLLGCIFFPKCYIILCRPELHGKLYLHDRNR